MAEKAHKQYFSQLNLDKNPRFFGDGDYSNMRNMRPATSEGGNDGATENILGNSISSNLKIFNTIFKEWQDGVLPVGENTTIGVIENQKDNEIYFFNYNSFNFHSIYRYVKSENCTYELFRSSTLNFEKDKIITSGGFQSGFLIWTDGGAPRMVDTNEIFKYDLPHLPDYTSLAKVAPITPLTFSLRSDSSSNLLNYKTFAFIYQYVFSDGSYSTWSPVSKLAVTGIQNDDDSVKNIIDITVDSAELKDTAGPGGTSRYAPLIDNIRIAFRDDANGSWKMFEEISFQTQIVTFRNNESYVTLSATETGEAFYSVPREAGTVEITHDRVITANHLEGFDNIDTIGITTQQKALEDSDQIYGVLSTYQFGIVFYDEFGRKSGVLTAPYLIFTRDRGTAIFPGSLSHQYLYPIMNFTKSEKPPVWAKHYQILRTEDLIKSTYISTYLDTRDGVVMFNRFINGVSTPSSVSLPDSTEVLFDMTVAVDEGTFPYIFVEGDRVVYAPGYDTFDLEIISYEDNILTCRWTHPDQPGAYGPFLNALIEVYTPRVVSDDLFFYEIGEVYPVINPGETSRDYSVPVIPLPKGPRFSVPVNPDFKSEQAYPHKQHDLIKHSNISRPNAVISNDKEVRKVNSIRISDPIIQDSNINGLSAFHAFDEKILASDSGPITKLQVASNSQAEGSVLLAIHSQDITSIYLNETIFQDTKGLAVVSIADTFLGSSNVLKKGLGTKHPESVIQVDGRVYGFDSNKGVTWRYSNNGLTKLSDLNTRDYHRKKGDSIDLNDAGIALGGFDYYHQEYLLTIGDVDNGFETIVWNENKGAYTGFYDIVPEYYGRMGNLLTTFKDGVLWTHDNETRNNFFDVQYDSELKFPCHTDPKSVKIFKNISIESTKSWDIPNMRTPEGQHSLIRQSRFRKTENEYYADILRDTNSKIFDITQRALIHGDDMRSQILEVEMVNSDSDLTLMYFTNVWYIDSTGHKL